MPEQVDKYAFGPVLRELRTAKNISLSELARRIYFTKGYVSRIETSKQRPSEEFARKCDAELGTNGRLRGMLTIEDNSQQVSVANREDEEDDEIWVTTMNPEVGGSFMALKRRDMLMGSMLVIAGIGTGPEPGPVGINVDGYLDYYRQMFDATRAIGQVSHPQVVLPMIAGQANALRYVATEARGGDARAIGTLSIRTAEYAGWMALEAGQNDLADWWADRAVRIATDVGDNDAAMYTLVRRALITMYQGNAKKTIEFAQQAQASSRTSPRIMGLAAQREAQGHALANNHDECMRALDRATRYLEAAKSERNDGPVIGTAHVPDPVSVVTGWCLYDLGRPKQAASVLDSEIGQIAPTAVRARTRFGLRQALAHATAGEVEHACALVAPMLEQVNKIGSATILTDVRKLAQALRRWPANKAVRELGPALVSGTYPRR